jgi:hypothetical protein
MSVGMSGRGLVHFLILELLLVGLLTMIGQVPWWMWFAASAFLLIALWIFDHRTQLLAKWQTAPAKQQLLAAATAIVTSVALAVGLTFVAVGSHQTTQSTPKNSPQISLEQSLLSVVGMETTNTHAPLRVTLVVTNAGKLPTTKMYTSMGYEIVEKHMTVEEIEKTFVEARVTTKAIPLFDFTLLPGQYHLLTYHLPTVTKEVFEDVKAGKKGVYVFLLVEYQDGAAQDGRRTITELAFRSSPFTHATAPLRHWSIIRNRMHVSEPIAYPSTTSSIRK